MSDTTSPEGNRNRNNDSNPEPVDYADGDLTEHQLADGGDDPFASEALVFVKSAILDGSFNFGEPNLSSSGERRCGLELTAADPCTLDELRG